MLANMQNLTTHRLNTCIQTCVLALSRLKSSGLAEDHGTGCRHKSTVSLNLIADMANSHPWPRLGREAGNHGRSNRGWDTKLPHTPHRSPTTISRQPPANLVAHLHARCASPNVFHTQNSKLKVGFVRLLPIVHKQLLDDDCGQEDDADHGDGDGGYVSIGKAVLHGESSSD
jgi:hypothetical protein